MLDIKFISEHPEQVQENCRRRGADVDVQALVDLYAAYKRQLHGLEEIRAEAKTVATQTRGRPDAALIARGKELRESEAQQSAIVKQSLDELESRLAWVPNMLDDRVPIGGEEANVVLRKVGEAPVFSFTPRPHDELLVGVGALDSERAVRAAKARFYALKNAAVLMRNVLAQHFVGFARDQGFELVSPPVLAKTRTLFASGYLPFSEKDNFNIDREGEERLTLIGTSEQILLGLHMDEVLRRLPVPYLGDSMCFRTEAGGYGRDTAGIIRVHQFYKLEQFVYCLPEESEHWHQQCLANEEKLMQDLEIPYQVVLTGSGDLAAPGRIKYDTEAWLPSQGRYREMTSNTNLGDYQTRRGNIRFNIDGKKGFPHTISATGFCDRLLAAIVEHYQNEDGSVRVPACLVAGMGGLRVLEVGERNLPPSTGTRS
jgi:seryl-tRNA synthetase